MCFAYCHIAYISPGSQKDCVKEPPPRSPPPPPSTSHSPPLCTILLHYELVVTDFLFFQFLFRSKFHKETAVFWRQMLANSIWKGTSPHSKRTDNAELFLDIFLKTTRPIAFIFPALFPQTKVR